jgi:serine/threonine protein kinase
MSEGAAPHRTDAPSALPPGTRLGEFELLSLLGVGGFGIVYLAFDHALEREVAVKEYMPALLAGRTETMRVSLRSSNDEESFQLGLKSFVNEAKLLARFDHPSLIKVLRFWEANGTAYMAMPVLRGRTIKAVRSEMGGPPDEPWLRGVLLPLLGAIEKLHSEGVYHRDIAPDNILIEPDGRPVLLDFGAARRVLSDKTQTLTAILKPAYAPIEQYAEAGSVRQGPWTDIYALGATLHYVLMGRPPAPATARTVEDEHSPLSTDLLPGCSERFLHVIDWMLCPRPADRPQSVAELRDVLEGRKPLPNRGQPRVQSSAPEQPWERTDVLPTPVQRPAPVDLDLGDETTRQARTPTARPMSAVDPEPDLPELALHMAAERAPLAPAARRGSGLALVLSGIVLAAAAAGAVWWPREPSPAPQPAPAPAPAPPPAASAPVAEPSPAPVAPSASAPAVSEPAGAASQSAAESMVPTVVVPAAETPKPERRARPQARPEPTPRPVAAEPIPAGPGPNCGPREGVRFHVCMDRECGSAEFSAHPACQRWKQDAKRE